LRTCPPPPVNIVFSIVWGVSGVIDKIERQRKQKTAEYGTICTGLRFGKNE
jgi:hypothetical protein